MARILLAEDERDLNALIARELEQDGHEVVRAFDGAAALGAAEHDIFDLAILDWMMPRIDGLEVCRRIREHHILPVLMLTARSEEADVIRGLEVGADDYVTKPFRVKELVARVHAILRRANTAAIGVPDDQAVVIGSLRIDTTSRAVTIDGLDAGLTPREFELVELFARNPGRAFSREYLLDRLWDGDYDVTDRTVDTHVQRLRKKLGDHAGLIKTVWGLGYKLQAPAQD
ncbi:MAG TPA: response regulator transcription factor [Tepidiformaceae bacterium]|nr:response regulator transcription factor [Tepidiformaceae bacterium]